MNTINNTKIVIVRRVLRQRRRTFFHVPKSLHQRTNTVDAAPQPSSHQLGNQIDTLSTQITVQPGVIAPMVNSDVRKINSSDLRMITVPSSPANPSDIVAHTDPILAQMDDGSTREATLSPDGPTAAKIEPETTENVHYEQSSYAQNDTAAILATLNILTEEVRKLRTEVGENTKKLDELCQAWSNVRQVGKTQPQTMDFVFINTVSEASVLEKKLEDEDFEEQLLAHFADDIARSWHLIGDNVAYELVDKVFTPQFFTTVSWTGSKRKGHPEKESFKQFVRIRKFFFKLCHSVDNNYTVPECDNFLHHVACQTSGARMNRTGARVSRVKNRRSKSASGSKKTPKGPKTAHDTGSGKMPEKNESANAAISLKMESDEIEIANDVPYETKENETATLTTAAAKKDHSNVALELISLYSRLSQQRYRNKSNKRKAAEKWKESDREVTDVDESAKNAKQKKCSA